MRKMAILALAVVVGAGLAISYVIYRQLETRTLMLRASPQLEPSEEGALCGDVDFVVEARTVARWPLPVQDGKTISGVVAVQGAESADIGFRVKTPHNRLALNEPEPQHRHQFELPSSIRGDYLFEFDNRHSAFTPKRVTVSLCLS